MRAPAFIAVATLAVALLIACGGSDAAPAAPSQPDATAATVTESPVVVANATEAPAAVTTEAAAESPAAAVAALPRIYFIHTEW